MCQIVFKTRGRYLEGTSEERLGLGIHIWKRPVKAPVSELTREGIERQGQGLNYKREPAFQESWEKGTRGTENQRLQEEFAKVKGVQ